ncbi:hypothetical protein GUITHDRAFT_118420 [Guillardia theta CCMP2712]|uniref:Uncharacterized protein n=2 Tax=Guillardia theta TaxID=55529 RepID=L1IH49_GUITC|nr:hypothetical protein GUITHDRAFT_118420 [Guillardia theta CCMP2712]EKX35402.1 hypothetical protein GUITHDRAFT_118420 [Guillardia theta CCMP2712]|eukprot:XP_005822382.1 hypothetical protein GUITHDRAFT_118420 [Guillardia theta CCMP2712]
MSLKRKEPEPIRPPTGLTPSQKIEELKRQHKALKMNLEVLNMMGSQALMVLRAPPDVVDAKAVLDRCHAELLDVIMEKKINDIKQFMPVEARDADTPEEENDSDEP